ncbi:unnamed protein product, partial [Didymodactylos carnosus]
MAAVELAGRIRSDGGECRDGAAVELSSLSRFEKDDDGRCLGDDYEDIIDYFEETYIGRLRPNQTRRQPKFGIDFW